MIQKTVTKENFNKLVAAVAVHQAMFGPVYEEGAVTISKLSAESVVAFDYTNVTLPVKSLIFTRRETLCTYEGTTLHDAPLPEQPLVIFGVRPCDTHALSYLDKVFLAEGSIDPFYKKRRESSVIISLACTNPAATCFCTSVNASPTGFEGTDILVYDLGSTLLFEAHTKKGEEFMQTYSSLFPDPSPEDKQRKQETLTALKTKERKMPIAFSDTSEAWERISELCLQCGTCTYLCPTCHCFGIYEEKTDKGASRIRVYESCQFPFFTQEASGHNPRSLGWERMRQRVLHKFQYAVENYDSVFCVGCGRCIQQCPVNLDVREILGIAHGEHDKN
ncbi:MAG: 4Fe-4S dicluster domain-containing protein [bacterium]